MYRDKEDSALSNSLGGRGVCCVVLGGTILHPFRGSRYLECNSEAWYQGGWIAQVVGTVCSKVQGELGAWINVSDREHEASVC